MALLENDLEFVSGDIRQSETVLAAASGVDCVCHLAAVNGTEFFYSKPQLLLEVAVKGMMNVLDACGAEGVRQLLTASSSEVYQLPPHIPEFPSGTREKGETPEKTAFRELIEETGFRAASIVPLGTYRIDVGRLDNVQYGFHASELVPLQNHAPEQGIELRLLTRSKLEEMIETGVFDFALHLAVWERFTRKFPKSARP